MGGAIGSAEAGAGEAVGVIAAGNTIRATQGLTKKRKRRRRQHAYA